MTTNAERLYHVRVGGQLAGTLIQRGDDTRFVLDGDYINDPNRQVLGLWFEEHLHQEHRSHMRTPPWFSNLLPEGPLRTWVARDREVSPDREMELLAHLGEDLPGAVTVREVDHDERVPAQEMSVIQAAEGRTTQQRWKFSLAGVAMKLSMLQSDDRFTCAARGVEDGDWWIVKLPDNQFPAVPLNEWAMMTLAKGAGLDVPEVRLLQRDQLEGVSDRAWTSSETVAFAIRRFDRRRGGGRVHIEDLAQVRNSWPVDKYLGSFETVGNLFYRGSDAASFRELVKRLVFCVLIENGDAHLKNWSLIYRERGQPVISPAYDFVATTYYIENDTMALKLAGSRRFEDVRMSSFVSMARRVDFPEPVEPLIRDFVASVQSAWPEVEASLAEVPELQRHVGEAITRGSRQLLVGG